MQLLIGKSVTHKTVQAGVNIHISNPEQTDLRHGGIIDKDSVTNTKPAGY